MSPQAYLIGIRCGLRATIRTLIVLTRTLIVIIGALGRISCTLIYGYASRWERFAAIVIALWKHLEVPVSLGGQVLRRRSRRRDQGGYRCRCLPPIQSIPSRARAGRQMV